MSTPERSVSVSNPEEKTPGSSKRRTSPISISRHEWRNFDSVSAAVMGRFYRRWQAEDVGPLGALAITGAGFFAGTINTVVGSGSLVTYPVLIALGYQPLGANVSNSIGLAPGHLSGAWGYRRELKGQRGRILW